MTGEEKLEDLKALMQMTDEAQDSTLAVFLALSEKEILSWLYSGKTPDGVTDVPAQ